MGNTIFDVTQLRLDSGDTLAGFNSGGTGDSADDGVVAGNFARIVVDGHGHRSEASKKVPILPASLVPCESLDAELAPIAAQLHDLQNRAVREYTPIVERMIRSGSRDVHEIEATLDGLLDFACVPDGLKLFKALCRYYYSIDPVSTASYVQSYRELWDEGEGAGELNEVDHGM
jgi:hypothetical protein